MPKGLRVSSSPQVGLSGFTLHPSTTSISSTVSARFQRRDAGVEELRQWLLCIVAASPSLKLFFNGRELQGPGVMHSSPDLREG
jgi:hypothetical protein